MHFIYVFSQEDADELLAKGYSFIKKSDRKPVWCFANKLDEMELNFDNNKVQCITSDTLVF